MGSRPGNSSLASLSLMTPDVDARRVLQFGEVAARKDLPPWVTGPSSGLNPAMFTLFKLTRS